MHFSERYVEAGKIVFPGTMIGRSGATGVYSTGPHYHEQIINPFTNEAYNPRTKSWIKIPRCVDPENGSVVY
ncbi:MAG: hypothetical protein EPN93_05225 [Spirochaetes bacterium]|nr:MAG: hypothetical protein EPN93_05225 [Spirochaetota bacterium]